MPKELISKGFELTSYPISYTVSTCPIWFLIRELCYDSLIVQDSYSPKIVSLVSIVSIVSLVWQGICHILRPKQQSGLKHSLNLRQSLHSSAPYLKLADICVILRRCRSKSYTQVSYLLSLKSKNVYQVICLLLWQEV